MEQILTSIVKFSVKAPDMKVETTIRDSREGVRLGQGIKQDPVWDHQSFERKTVFQIPCLREERACHWLFFLSPLPLAQNSMNLSPTEKQAGG